MVGKKRSEDVTIMSKNLLQVVDLKKYFPVQRGLIASLMRSGVQRFVKAVDGVSFQIGQGETLALAGESGCGKTTTAFTAVKLYEPSAGKIFFEGRDISMLKGQDLKNFRKNVQIIFQDPYGSLNPRLAVYDSVAEPLIIHGIGNKDERIDLVCQALERAGLSPATEYLTRYPHELSGGQRQRVAIGKAIVLEPKILVADEPISMLDVSIRAGILDLLKMFTKDMGIGMLYISHDLSTIRYFCDRTAIMYLGIIVEFGPTDSVIDHPQHLYTQALVSSVPVPDPNYKRNPIDLGADIPDPIDLPSGCRFRQRCGRAQEICREVEPKLKEVRKNHYSACWQY